MGEMDDMIRMFEITLFDKIVAESECKIPEDILTLIRCLTLSGCPLKSVLKGFVDFGQKMSEEDEKESLRELLKGLPIIWEDN